MEELPCTDRAAQGIFQIRQVIDEDPEGGLFEFRTLDRLLEEAFLFFVIGFVMDFVSICITINKINLRVFIESDSGGNA